MAWSGMKLTTSKSSTEIDKVYCIVKDYEKTECTFENCPIYLYKDCYDSAKDDCRKNIAMEI